MRTLCVKQPWADLIASGKKTIELRTWRIKPGPLAIAASKKTTGNLPGGCIVAVVEVVGCRPAMPEDSAAACFKVEHKGQFWAVELASPLRLPVPVPVKGRLGLFDVELEVSCQSEPK